LAPNPSLIVELRQAREEGEKSDSSNGPMFFLGHASIDFRRGTATYVALPREQLDYIHDLLRTKTYEEAQQEIWTSLGCRKL